MVPAFTPLMKRRPSYSGNLGRLVGGWLVLLHGSLALRSVEDHVGMPSFIAPTRVAGRLLSQDPSGNLFGSDQNLKK